MKIYDLRIAEQGNFFFRNTEGLNSFIEFLFLNSKRKTIKLILQLKTLGADTVHSKQYILEENEDYRGRSIYYPTGAEESFLSEATNEFIGINKKKLFLN